VLGAGALCHLLWKEFSDVDVSDSGRMAHQLYQLGQTDILKAASESRNGQKLLSNPDLRDDVPFCMAQDTCNFAAALEKDGQVKIHSL
jgi:phosphosulfolactate phosphohydrolase-like enzyme